MADELIMKKILTCSHPNSDDLLVISGAAIIVAVWMMSTLNELVR